jgi:nucleoside-diphosphate-sugar epimerase
MKILIAGYGYVGSALARVLMGAGHEVWGIRRNWPLDIYRPTHAISADLLNPAALRDLPNVDVIVCCQAPNREQDTYERTYLEATQNVIDELEHSGATKLIFISSTSVYGTSHGEWIDEDTTPEAEGYLSDSAKAHADILLAAEAAVLESDIPSTVLRLGGVYGPGRNRLKPLKEGKFQGSFDETYTNRIHRDDICSAILLLIEKGKPGEVYLGVDDHPCTQKEFYEWLYEKMNLKRPAQTAAKTSVLTHATNKRCSNKKIKALGLSFKFPSYREGYAALLRNE